ncbi:MAG: hypothetical protein ACOYMB_01965 [Patescibacteria group bacterium]
MKKIQSWRDLKIGIIYNRVYNGNNAAYAKVNGKETFIVTETDSVLKVQELFARFGSPFSDELRREISTFTHPEIAFKEFDLYEPESKNEWFIKSVKLNSLAEALDAKLINLDSIKGFGKNRKNFIAHFGENMKMLGVECSFSVEGAPDNPLLQTVYIVWKTWEEQRNDFAKYNVKTEY